DREVELEVGAGNRDLTVAPRAGGECFCRVKSVHVPSIAANRPAGVAQLMKSLGTRGDSRENGRVLNPDADLIRALAADLADADFRSAPLRAGWGVEADDAIGRTLRTPALRGLGDRTDPQAVLARLLIFGVAQPVSHVDDALPRTGSAGLVTLGLARVDAHAVTPTAIVRPQSFHDDRGPGEWWVASDLDELATGGGSLPDDHVRGVGGASLTLAGLQLPTPARRVLDLGTGCGVQALRARRYADEVVATDISERALAFTRMNALLDGTS